MAGEQLQMLSSSYQNNIFMNDSQSQSPLASGNANGMFIQGNNYFNQIGARSNSLIPQRVADSGGYNNHQTFSNTGDALDRFLEQHQQMYNHSNGNMTSTTYGG